MNMEPFAVLLMRDDGPLYGCGTSTERAGHFDNGTEANGGEGGI